MSFHLKYKENTLFHFDCFSEIHQLEKGQRKNLPEAIYYKDTPKGALKNVSCEYAGWRNT